MSSQQQLLEWLRDGEVIEKREAAERLGVGERQVRRLVKNLQEEGIAVEPRMEAGRRVYALPEEERRPMGASIDVTERQMMALLVAAMASRAALGPTPLADDLQSAVRTLLDELGGGILTFEPDAVAQRFYFRDAPSVDVDPHVFAVLRRAVQEQERVEIDYFTASRQTLTEGRRIEPLGFGVQSGTWICVAYCHHAGGLRDFNLVGVRDVRRTGQYFGAREEFSLGDHFAGRFGALAGDDEPTTVRLRLTPEAVPYFRRKTYHPTQSLSDVADDGSATVSYHVRELESIATFVRSWGAKVEVLSPEALREDVAATAQAVVGLYGG